MSPETRNKGAAPDAWAVAGAPLRTVWWLMRRELWEHRSLYLAPLAVAAFAVFVHFASAVRIAPAERAAALADPAGGGFMSAHAAIMGVVLVLGQLVGVLYAIDALQSERRDRSILFWKSLPVSDRATVLSKAAVVMVVLPLLVAVLALAASVVAVGLQTLVWRLAGFEPAQLWARLDMPMLWIGLLAAMPFMMLWNAPLYAWLLLVSAWARRVAFLWAAAPFVALLIVEHTALHETPSHWMVERRLAGAVLEPFARLNHHGEGVSWITGLHQLDLARLYSLPGLWVGAGLAALLLIGATRLRRSRTPL